LELMGRINWADALAIIVIIRSCYVGSQRGLLGELFCIFGMFLAVIFSLHYYYSLAQFMINYMYIPGNIANLTSFVLIIGIAYLIFVALYRFVVNMKIIKIDAFPSLNRIGGALIGFFKGVAIASVLFLALLLVPIKYFTDSAKSRSLLGPALAETGVVVYEKSLSIFAYIKARNLSEHLSGAQPIKFDKMKIKRKDKLEQILE